MSAAVQASPLNRLAANLEELGLEGMASSVPEYVRLVADGRKSLVDARSPSSGAPTTTAARGWPTSPT